MSNPKYQQILQGNPIHLATEQMIQFKVYCSSLSLPLDRWIFVAQTFYKIDPASTLQILLYVEKHELNRAAFKDYTHQNSKIHIYNSLAGLHLAKAIKQAPKQQIQRYLAETRRYINSSQKVKMTAGRVYLTLRGFIYFYQGNFDLSTGNFNKSIQSIPQDDSQSIVGILGLAQTYFAKRNYQNALNCYKKALNGNKTLPTKARLGMAYCFYELQKYEMAKFCFKRIIDLDSKCIEARIGYATLSYFQGEKQLYFKTLEYCYKLNKYHPLVLLHLCQHYLFLKQFDKVIVLAQRGLNELKKFPIFTDKNQNYRNDQIQYKCRFNHILGLIYHQKSDYQQCLKYYNYSLNKNLLFPNINLAQAYINPNNPNFVEAIRLLQQTAKQISPRLKRLLNQTQRSVAYIKSKISGRKQKTQSIESYNQALKYNPKDYESYIECGNLLLQLDHRKCLAYYQSAYNILVQNNDFIQPQLLNNIGVLKIATRQYKQAENFLRNALKHIQFWKERSMQDQQIKIIKQKAFTLTFNFNLAILYEQTSRCQQAIENYIKVLQINPYYLDVYIRLAYFQFKRGNYKEALNKCDIAIKISQQNKSKVLKSEKIYIMKAYIYRMLRDQRTAKQIVRDIHKDAYSLIFQQTLDYDILIQRSESNTRNLRQNLKSKAQTCLKLCQDDHHNVYTFMFLGVLLAQLQKNRQSLECFNQIKQYDNQHCKILYNMGIYYFKIQEYQSSLILFKKYVQKCGGHFQSEFILAIILFVQNRFEQAIKSIKKLILLNPGNLLLRFNLNIFLQRYSESALDHKNKQIGKTRKSICYLRKLYHLYNYLSKLNINQYLKGVENHQLKEKLKQQLSKIRQKSEDQKLYIRSREQSFGNYQKQAEMKQKATLEQKKRLQNKLRQIKEKRQQSQLQQNKKLQLQAERRRLMIAKQKQLQDKLNQSYKQELDLKVKDVQVKKSKNKNKKSSRVGLDKQPLEYQARQEEYLVEMPKQIKKKRLMKKRKDSIKQEENRDQSDSQDRYVPDEKQGKEYKQMQIQPEQQQNDDYVEDEYEKDRKRRVDYESSQQKHRVDNLQRAIMEED